VQSEIHTTIDEIEPEAWNRLIEPGNPFLNHAFLAALEHQGAVGEQFGWLPRHITLRNEQDQIVAAAPLYLKDNSYGEFVFDWNWADAWQRAGLDYYPKLVSAIPYTPASGNRLLVAAEHDTAALRQQLLECAVAEAKRCEASSLHWLFPTASECEQLVGTGLLPRLGTQFHWHNQNYRDFDDFLERFTAAKRKKLRRERRQVVEAGIEFDILHGDEIEEPLWPQIHHFYAATFYEKGGIPTLSEGFFREIGQTMGDRLVVILARREGRYIAGAICFRSDDTLYGRHWGAIEQHHSLHFETCLYQGIEYCIKHGLRHFEPGAQGEHKVSRGFEPTPTWSAHWIANDQFQQIIARHLQQEEEMMQEYMSELSKRLPFKQELTDGA